MKPLEEGCSRTCSHPQCVGVGNGRRDSDRENNSSGYIKTDFLQALSNNTEEGNFSFMHFYSAWLFYFAVALLHVFIDTEEGNLHVRKNTKYS